MKNLLLGIVAVVAAGCASVAPPGVQERAEAVHERTAEMDAAVKRITEVSGSTIPDHPNYTVLGPVSGDCEGSPQGNQEIIAGDSVKEAAVRKYGARVDAIINSDAVYGRYRGRNRIPRMHGHRSFICFCSSRRGATVRKIATGRTWVKLAAASTMRGPSP
jgi:hypothetical protein